MEIRRLKFNWVSTVEACIAAILVIPAITIWWKGISAMSYCRNFDRSLAYYSADQAVFIEQNIRTAEKARPDDIPLSLFKANYLTENGKIKEAQELYKNLVDSTASSSLVWAGLGVCELYQIEEIKDIPTKQRELQKLLKKTEELIKEDSKLSDIHILQAHIYLQMAILSTGDTAKNSQNLDIAWKKFQDIQEKTSRCLKMDRNSDGKIADTEWVGKSSEFSELDANGDGTVNHNELAAIWMPPSKNAVISLYTGLGLCWFLKGWGLYNPLIESGQLEVMASSDPQTQEITQCFHEAALNLRRAFSLSWANYTLAKNIAQIYSYLLCLHWIPSETRNILIKETEEYEREMIRAKSFMRDMGDKEKADKWNVETYLAFTKYGIAISYFYLGNYNQAERFLNDCMGKDTANYKIFQNTLKRVQMVSTIKKWRENKKNLEFPKDMDDYQKREQQRIVSLNTQKLSASDFIQYNNFIVYFYLRNKDREDKEYLVSCKTMLEKLLDQAPDAKLNIAGIKGSPVYAREIVLHNLHMVNVRLKPKSAQQTKKNQLQWEDTSENK